MDELTEMQAEALKSATEKKLRQFYAELDEIFKAYNVTGLNDTKFSSPQKDGNSENKKEVKNDRLNSWEVKILLASKKTSNKSSEETLKDKPDRLPECRVVSLIPLVVECD